ncbi:MAG: hypothetical protein M3P30_04345 [Chloroflexota bacterium]|nr:hypothetical protein [Chloroflexota bacterium]
MFELERSISRLLRMRGQAREEIVPENVGALTSSAFRALMAERLRILERDVADVRARANGVLFVVAGAVITQLVLRLIA